MAAPVTRMLGLVGELLEAGQPANIDRGSVTLTGEGPEEGILLVPHRDLGGYSLVLWFSNDGLDVLWASVIDLEYHDELDMGEVVASFKGDGWLVDDAVKSAIQSELMRPIRVRVKRTRLLRRWRLWCGIEQSGKWEEALACHVPSPPPGATGAVVELGLTSLMGPARPDIRCPVPVKEWHRRADAAWPREAPA